jgi:hypothetical protein
MSKERFPRYASALVAVMIAVLIMAPAYADLVGHYRVSGTMPNGSHYSGVVAIELVGNTFHVVREVAGRRETGTGIGYKNILAVSYRSADSPILALYTQDDAGQWTGTWTRVGTSQVGTELWQPYVPNRQDGQFLR